MTAKPSKPPSQKLSSRRQPAAEIPAAQAQLPRERQQVELFAEITFKIRQSLQLKEILRTIVTEVQAVPSRSLYQRSGIRQENWLRISKAN